MYKGKAPRRAWCAYVALCLPIAPIGLLFHDGDVLGMFIIRPLWFSAGGVSDPVLSVIFRILVVATGMCLLAGTITATVVWVAVILILAGFAVVGKGLWWLAALSPTGAVVAVVAVIGVLGTILYKYREPLTDFAARVVLAGGSAIDLVSGRDLKEEPAVAISKLGSLLIFAGVVLLFVQVAQQIPRRLPEMQQLLIAKVNQLPKQIPSTPVPSPNELRVVAPVGQWSELIYVGGQVPSWHASGRFLVKTDESETYPHVAKKARRVGVRTMRFKSVGDQPVEVYLTGAGLAVIAGKEKVLPPPVPPPIRQPEAKTEPTATETAADTDTEGMIRGAYRTGGAVSVPSILFRVEPVYTEEARQARFSGTVLVQLVVDVDGRAKNFKILKSAGMGLDENAIEAIKQWRFTPGRKNGRAVPVWAQIAANFNMLEGPHPWTP